MSRITRKEVPPTILPFHADEPSVVSTEEFEVDFPPSPFGGTFDFRFFPAKLAGIAIASPSESRVILPNGSVLLVSFRPQSRGRAAGSLPF